MDSVEDGKQIGQKSSQGVGRSLILQSVYQSDKCSVYALWGFWRWWKAIATDVSQVPTRSDQFFGSANVVSQKLCKFRALHSFRLNHTFYLPSGSMFHSFNQRTLKLLPVRLFPQPEVFPLFPDFFVASPKREKRKFKLIFPLGVSKEKLFGL